MFTFIILAAILVILFYVIHRSSKPKKKSSHRQTTMDAIRKIGSNSYGNYWAGFKQRKPNQAAEIQNLVDKDLDYVSDAEAFEIATTFLRWSENSGQPIKKLKEFYLSNIQDVINEGNPQAVIDILLEQMQKEADVYHISEENTIVAYMIKWTLEEFEKRKS